MISILNVHVLGLAVFAWFLSQVQRCHVVRDQRRWALVLYSELITEIHKPHKVTSTLVHCHILSFHSTLRIMSLLPRFIRDSVPIHLCNVATNTMSLDCIVGVVRISVDLQLHIQVITDLYVDAERCRCLEIPKESLGLQPLLFSERGQVLAETADCMSDFQPRARNQILQGANDLTIGHVVFMLVLMLTIILATLWSCTSIAVCHVVLLQNLLHVVLLSIEHSGTAAIDHDFNAE